MKKANLLSWWRLSLVGVVYCIGLFASQSYAGIYTDSPEIASGIPLKTFIPTDRIKSYLTPESPPTAAETLFKDQNPLDFVLDGKFYGNLNYRYEHVDQNGFSNDATASTLRSRVGFVSGIYKDFQGAVEVDHIGTIGTSRYNSTINGKSQFPVVADPHTTELNALWLKWTGLPDTAVKFGRQPLNLDNLRFIGTVGWRQNDQTYDGVVFKNDTIRDLRFAKNLRFFYSYLYQVNRVFGHNSPVGKFKGDIHLGRIEYEVIPNQTFVAYTYWLDFDRHRNFATEAISTKTYGLRFFGNLPLNSDFKLIYQIEGARQHDLGNNPNDFSLSYYHVAPGIAWRTLSFEAGIESLGSNGRQSFSTPLATLHAHNGWADKFLVTPQDGLQDRYLKLKYVTAGFGPWIDNTVIQLIYHDFNSVKGTTNFGNEWNASITRDFSGQQLSLPPFIKKVSLGLKYADYDAKSLSTDTRKGWLWVGVTF